MSTKTVDFTIEEYFVFATGEWDEETETVMNIEYECNLEVDDEMDEIILDYSDRLLREKFDRDELNFT